MRLTRAIENNKGVIRDNGCTITLRGGHFHIFMPVEPGKGQGERAVLDRDGNVICLHFGEGLEGCPVNCPACENPQGTASIQSWPDWNTLFASMVARGMNVLRIFLTNGTVLKDGIGQDIYPFNRINNKLDVYSAVALSTPSWNTTYFDTLKNFVRGADNCGIAVQLCLFNFFDLAEDDRDAQGQLSPYYRVWDKSPWNPTATRNPTSNPNWGIQNLVNVVAAGPEPAKRRCEFFVDPNNGLLNVQKAFVDKVVSTVCGFGNVILEIMNEPRGGVGGGAASENIAKWYSKVVGWIIAGTTTTWRPLISVNASNAIAPYHDFDIDIWKQRKNQTAYKDYDKVDIVSYHGLSGRLESNLDLCGVVRSYPWIDKRSIEARVDIFYNGYDRNGQIVGNHPDKALLFSTDGVHQLPHLYNNQTGQGVIELRKRDGQITTSFPNDPTGPDDDKNVQRRESDLANWAFWCLRPAAAAPGTIHFQNLSSTERSFEIIDEGRRCSENPAQPAITFPRSGGQSRPWRWVSEQVQRDNFWWAHRNNAGGEIVNQLGTVENQKIASLEAKSDVGWQYTFTAARTGLHKFIVDYTPISVSEVEGGGAEVYPMIAARLSNLLPGGDLGSSINYAEVVLARGARPGQLTLTGNLVQGSQYSVAYVGRVRIRYEARKQGYGEVIIRFPCIREVEPR